MWFSCLCSFLAGRTGSDELPSLQWKRLIVTCAPVRFASCYSASSMHSSENHTSSLDSEDSAGSNASELPYVGGGRDYHTMHYVRTSSDEEREKGMRVLVLGNILVSSKEEDGNMFETEEFRIEEVRIRQPMLEAQWTPRRFTSMWTPRPRQAHSSVVRFVCRRSWR